MNVSAWFHGLPGLWRKFVAGWSLAWFGALLLLWWLASRTGELSEDDDNE